MNRAQRILVILSCIGIAILMHTYFGEWVEDSPMHANFWERVSYVPDHSIVGLRVFIRHKPSGMWGDDEYLDIRGSVLFLAGILMPVLVLVAAAYLCLSPRNTITSTMKLPQKQPDCSEVRNAAEPPEV